MPTQSVANKFRLGSPKVLNVVTLLSVLLIFGIAPGLRWMRLFPLVEYRSKVFFDFPLSWMMKGWLLVGDNMYTTPFYFDTWVGRICDTDVTCLNAIPQMINFGTAVALFFISINVFNSRLISGLVASLWLLSVPYLETMAWQALNLDKLAALSTAIGTFVGLRYFKSTYKVSNVLKCNLLLLLIIAMGYNSKPTAWILIPGLWLLPIVGGGMTFGNWSKHLLAPSLYGVMNNYYWYSKVQADDFYRSHTSTGDPVANLTRFIGILNGGFYPSLLSSLIFVTVVAILAVGAFRKSPDARFGSWCVLMVFGGLIITARTQYGAPFYMMVSQIFYLLAVGSLISGIVRTMHRKTIARLVLTTTTAVFFLINYGHQYFQSYEKYDTVLQQSDNFRASLVEIGHAFRPPNDENRSLILVITELMDYKFVDGGMLQRFMPKGFPVSDSNISYLVFDQDESTYTKINTTYVFYDSEMRITSILHL